jgi:2-C-methyl-D-erythritol 2,4-cyclodiphosphate synthase
MTSALRIGIGYDIHRLVEGRKLVLGGVEIAFEKGLLGHSDSDVLTHAICDALLGAAALGDIGTHFPDTDAQWAGASSLDFLARVVELLADRGYRVANVDATVMAERPKLKPHIQAIRERLASELRVDVDQVSVKAKTSEGLESVGRGEAIAAHAVALLTAQ